MTNNTLADKLKSRIVKSEVLVANSKSNRLRIKNLRSQLKESVREEKILIELKAKTEDKIKDIDEFLVVTRSKSLQDVYQALTFVDEIIPNCSKLEPHIEKGEFYIKDQDGDNIVRKEGDGAASVASVLTRTTVLNHTNYLNFLILDESLACVSNSSSINFSKYLPSLGKNSLIILIEQKPTVFQDAGEIISYNVVKEPDDKCHLYKT